MQEGMIVSGEMQEGQTIIGCSAKLVKVLLLNLDLGNQEDI